MEARIKQYQLGEIIHCVPFIISTYAIYFSENGVSWIEHYATHELKMKCGMKYDKVGYKMVGV